MASRNNLWEWLFKFYLGFNEILCRNRKRLLWIQKKTIPLKNTERNQHTLESISIANYRVSHNTSMTGSQTTASGKTHSTIQQIERAPTKNNAGKINSRQVHKWKPPGKQTRPSKTTLTRRSLNSAGNIRRCSPEHRPIVRLQLGAFAVNSVPPRLPNVFLTWASRLSSRLASPRPKPEQTARSQDTLRSHTPGHLQHNSPRKHCGPVLCAERVGASVGHVRSLPAGRFLLNAPTEPR